MKSCARILRRVLVFVLMGSALVLSAAVTLPPLFSDGAVLQRDQEVFVWGKAEPREKVDVRFRGKSVSAKADEHGAWKTMISSGRAGGPFELTVATADVTWVRNVWVGEVWIASGQSNMERHVGQDNSADDLADASTQPAEPMIRMFTAERAMVMDGPASEVKGAWLEAAPDNVKLFSSVGYFFARKLQRELKIPVGIIHSSWGGTYAESWLSQSALEPLPAFQAAKLNYEKRLAAYGEQRAVYEKSKGENKSIVAPTAPIAPNSLFNGMIAPLAPYSFQGVIWYQGEANIGNGYEYRELLTALIKDWRKLWSRDFPFLIVQIAPYRAVVDTPVESNSALLRESQRFVSQHVPQTALVVTADLGHECDVHPTPKKPVGERLAAQALKHTYGFDMVASGPTPRHILREGDSVRISFDDVGTGLVVREWQKSQPKKDRQNYLGYAWRAKPVDGAPMKSGVLDFALAGADRIFRNAKAHVEGSTVLVSAPEVHSPKYVRYGWQEHPVGNLFNREGFPASPFQEEVTP